MRSNAISWRRVRALCIKETRQIVRDPSSWLIAVVIPLLLLFIFGYGINLDSSRLRVGILLEQQSEEALSFTHAMTGSPYIDATISDSRQELIQKMQAGKIRGLIVIPVDFAANMARANTDAPILVITDGSEPNTANFVQGYAEGIWQLWQMQRAEDRGEEFKPLIDVQTRYWFNPAAISQHFIIPGAVTIIMTVIGAILTSLVIAREWERGTMEALLSTEVTRVELLLCKLIPYYFLGMLAMLLCMLVALLREHAAKPVPGGEYSGGANYQHAVFNGVSGDVYRVNVVENEKKIRLAIGFCRSGKRKRHPTGGRRNVSPTMDVNTQRAAVPAARAANPRHSGVAGADPGFAVPVCRDA